MIYLAAIIIVVSFFFPIVVAWGSFAYDIVKPGKGVPPTAQPRKAISTVASEEEMNVAILREVSAAKAKAAKDEADLEGV